MDQDTLFTLVMNAKYAHDRAVAARRSIERTLRGVAIGPTSNRRLSRRFRHLLLRPAGTTVVITRLDKDGVSEQLELHLSRLGVTGHLYQQAARAEHLVSRGIDRMATR